MANHMGKRFSSIICLVLFSVLNFVNAASLNIDKTKQIDPETVKNEAKCSFPPKSIMYGDDTSDSAKAPILCTNSSASPSIFVVEGCKLIYNFTQEICDSSFRNFESPLLLRNNITAVCQTIEKEVDDAIKASSQPPVLLQQLAHGSCKYLCSESESYSKICNVLLLGFQLSLHGRNKTAQEQKLKSKDGVVTISSSKNNDDTSLARNKEESENDLMSDKKEKASADEKTDDKPKEPKEKGPSTSHGPDEQSSNNESNVKANNAQKESKVANSETSALKPEKVVTKNQMDEISEKKNVKILSNNSQLLEIASVAIPGNIPNLSQGKPKVNNEAKQDPKTKIHLKSTRPETQKSEQAGTDEKNDKELDSHSKDAVDLNRKTGDVNNETSLSKKDDDKKQKNEDTKQKDEDTKQKDEDTKQKDEDTKQKDEDTKQKDEDKKQKDDSIKETISTDDKTSVQQIGKNPPESSTATGTAEPSENMGDKLDNKDLSKDQFLPADNSKKEELSEKPDNKESPNSLKTDANEKDDFYGVNESETEGDEDDGENIQVDNPISKQGQEESTTNKKGFSKSSGINPVAVEFPEYTDSHFFTYFLTVIVLCIVVYLVFHNKQKIIALIIEGRHEQRRRPNTTNYKKLDSNLEEMMQGGKKDTSSTHIIF